MAEIERGQAGLVFRVMEALAFMDAYERIERYSEEDRKNGVKPPSGRMVNEVMKRAAAPAR